MLHIIGFTKDYRTDTNIVYAQIAIRDYFKLVGEDFDRFEIQRKRETHPAYVRMKQDIIKGALLPTITLAVNPDIVDNFISVIQQRDIDSLKTKILETKNLYILDGLQRTYVVHDLYKEGIVFNENQQLLLEFWFEGDIKHLIYRLIVLNAGQKPMSLRHQVELLFMTMQEHLKKEIPGLHILTEKEGDRRTGPGKFSFDRIVSGYYSFLTKSPEKNRENIIVQKMSEDDVLDMNEEELSGVYSKFRDFFFKYCELDSGVYKVYSNFPSEEMPGAKNWLSDENVINSFFAALAIYCTDDKRIDRTNEAIDNMVEKLGRSSSGDDPFALADYSKIRREFNPRKVNVGFATRKLLLNGFKEFFRDKGETDFSEYWKMSSE